VISDKLTTVPAPATPQDVAPGKQRAVPGPSIPIQDPRSKIQNPAIVAGAVALLYLGLLGWLWGHFQGDPLGFVHEGTVWLHPERQGTNGYDGQFYLYIAQHPLHAVPFLDLPSIRLQRIFFPLLIDLAALGQRPLMPYAMLLLNWLAVGGGTLLVARLLQRWGRSPWFALSYALAAGIPVALQFDTPEPLAFALVALAVTYWEPQSPERPDSTNPKSAGERLAVGSWGAGDDIRIATDAVSNPKSPIQNPKSAGPKSPIQNPKFLAWGALAAAAALLTREHALYFVAAYAGAALLRRDGRGLLAAVAALVPVTLWGLYLSAQLGKSSVAELPPLESIPFITYWIQGNLVDPTWRSAGYAAQYIAPATVFGILGLAAVLRPIGTWLRTRVWQAPAALGLAMVGNVHLLAFIPRAGYQHQIAASRYALGLALAAVLWTGASRPRWLLWLTPLCALGLLAYLYGLLTQDPAYLW